MNSVKDWQTIILVGFLVVIVLTLAITKSVDTEAIKLAVSALIGGILGIINPAAKSLDGTGRG